jgi:AAA domain
MADIWDRLQKASAVNPPRIVIYGPPKKGKTTLASEFPSPIFLQVEDGTPAGLTLASFGKLDSYVEVLEAIGALYDNEHAYKTVVIDSLDKLEPMIWTAICAEKNWDSIESPGYGKGYVEADSYWRAIMESLLVLRNERGMTSVLICHSEVGRFDDPTTVSYSQYDMRLHKRAKALICDDADAILLVKEEATIREDAQGPGKKGEKRAIAEGVNRFIYCEGRPAFLAGNRYNLPAKLRYDKGKGYAALAPYLPAQAQPAAPEPAKSDRLKEAIKKAA